MWINSWVHSLNDYVQWINLKGDSVELVSAKKGQNLQLNGSLWIICFDWKVCWWVVGPVNVVTETGWKLRDCYFLISMMCSELVIAHMLDVGHFGAVQEWKANLSARPLAEGCLLLLDLEKGKVPLRRPLLTADNLSDYQWLTFFF